MLTDRAVAAGVRAPASYVVGVTTGPGSSTAWLQVALGVTAHAAAAGCLPSTSTMAVVVPALLVGLAVISRTLRAVPRPVALIAGQCLVHATMSVAAACGAHEAAALHASAVTDAPTWLTLLMAPAHMLALLLSVAAAAYVERAAQTAAHLAGHLLHGLHIAVALLTYMPRPVRDLPRVVAQRRPARLRPTAVLAQASPRAPPASAAPAFSHS